MRNKIVLTKIFSQFIYKKKYITFKKPDLNDLSKP